MEQNENQQLKFESTVIKNDDDVLEGVIKPKKQLPENVNQAVVLLTDYYNIYIWQNKLKPLKNVKEEIEIVKNNELYHPAFICLLLILRLVNGENAEDMATIILGTFEMYVNQGFENYTAVSNILAMFKLNFQKDGNVQLEMVPEEDLDKIVIEVPEEGQ